MPTQQEPSGAFSSPDSPVESTEDPELEATELADQRRVPAHPSPHPSNISTVQEAPSVSSQHRIRTVDSRLSASNGPLKRWWYRQVSIRVPHDACRDHLALERTYLGYLRTALAFSNFGIVVAQLFRLQEPKGDDEFSYHSLARPMAAVFVGASIVVNVLGGWRFWRQQNAIVRGKIYTSGWELYVIGSLAVAVLVLILALTMRVDVEQG